MIPFFSIDADVGSGADFIHTDASPLNENVTDFVEFHIEMDFPEICPDFGSPDLLIRFAGFCHLEYGLCTP